MNKEPERITQASVSEVKKSATKAQKAKVAKPYKCEFPGCDRTFKSRAGLASHVRAAHEVSDAEKLPEKDNKVQKYNKQVDVMRDRLEKQPKVMFIIPLAPGEKPGATIEVGINGCFFSYPKGKYFEAPRSIVELIQNYVESQAGAGKMYKIDPSNPDDQGKEIRG